MDWLVWDLIVGVDNRPTKLYIPSRFWKNDRPHQNWDKVWTPTGGSSVELSAMGAKPNRAMSHRWLKVNMSVKPGTKKIMIII